MKKNTVRIAWFGVFTALALIFSYVETLIPFQIGIPGVKLGLANLIVVVALYKMGGKDALLLSVTRIVLSGFIFASLFSILYLSLIHISEPTRRHHVSRMPSSA